MTWVLNYIWLCLSSCGKVHNWSSMTQYWYLKHFTPFTFVYWECLHQWCWNLYFTEATQPSLRNQILQWDLICWWSQLHPSYRRTSQAFHLCSSRAFKMYLFSFLLHSSTQGPLGWYIHLIVITMIYRDIWTSFPMG